jgi:hypothetical protein
MAELIIAQGDRRDHLYEYVFTTAAGKSSALEPLD